MPPNHSYNHFQAKSSIIVQQHRGWHTTRYWSESGAQGALFQTHQATATTSTPFNPPTTAAPTICSTVGNTRSGGAQSVAEKSHRGMSRPRRLLQFPFYHPKKIWWMANHHQLEELNRHLQIQHFKMDQYTRSGTSSTEGTGWASWIFRMPTLQYLSSTLTGDS